MPDLSACTPPSKCSLDLLRITPAGPWDLANLRVDEPTPRPNHRGDLRSERSGPSANSPNDPASGGDANRVRNLGRPDRRVAGRQARPRQGLR